MKQDSNIKESILYQVWKDHNFKKTFKTLEGEEIVVIDCGTFNDQLAGPDFINARVKIGNITYIGDIEIDNTYTDWKAHGHNINGKYSKVILHVSLINKTHQESVYTRDGRKIPSVSISEYIDKKIIEKLNCNDIEKGEGQSASLKCRTSIKSIPSSVIDDFIIQLGIQRFERKRKKIYQRLKELQFLNELGTHEPVISYDLSQQFHLREFSYSDFTSTKIWQQLLYEEIFEALGYDKNKSQMCELAKNANINIFSNIEKDGAVLEKYEAALLKISGLFPEDYSCLCEEDKKYWDRLNYYWDSIQPFYDSKIMEESSWNFFRLRPQNFPTLRIAGGARIIYDVIHNNLIESLIKKMREIINLNVLGGSLRSSFIIKANGYWKDHYVIGQTAAKELNYFIGAARADEIVINVVLPFFSMYFDIFGNRDLSQKILKVYSMYSQSIDNKIVSTVAESLNITEESRRAIVNQGILELFRSLCSRNKCLECRIGKAVFD